MVKRLFISQILESGIIPAYLWVKINRMVCKG